MLFSVIDELPHRELANKLNLHLVDAIDLTFEGNAVHLEAI